MATQRFADLVAVSPSEEHLRTALQAAGVVGTVITIGLALFLQWGLVRYRRPRLTLEVSLDLADEDMVVLEFKDRMELWLRLKVRSQPKKVTAHNVQVLLMKVRRPPAGERAPVVPSRQLRWADTQDDQLAIPAGSWRRVDVLKLGVYPTCNQDAGLLPALRSYVENAPSAPRSARRRLRSASRASNRCDRQRQYGTDREALRENGEYVFELAITADEIEAARWELSFRYEAGTAGQTRDLVRQITQVILTPV
jgi:hypothetical protein